MQEITKTSETTAKYFRIFEQISKLATQDMKAFHLSNDDSDGPTPHAIVQAFIQREPLWSKSTAKLYRIAVAYSLENIGTPDAYTAKKELKGDFKHVDDDEELNFKLDEFGAHKIKVDKERLERAKAIANGELKPNTSGQKAKNISKKDLSKLISELMISKSKWAEPTRIWLAAGYLAGLRPIEWSTATIKIDGNEKWLIVKNAKHSNGRAFATERKLKITKLGEEEFAILENHVLRANEAFKSNQWNDFYSGCRFFLLQTAKRLWPERATHPTLYTSRHMFAANAKAVFGRTEVAALMGHSSDKTASLHYARKRWANGGMDIEPDSNDVITVASLNKKPDLSKNLESIMNGNRSSGKTKGTYK